MIFNKNEKGAQEIRNITGMYYGNNDFDRIRTNILLETKNICKTVGNAVFERAKTFYFSANFEADAQNATQAQIEQNALNRALVSNLQMPIALFACYHYKQENIISHEDDGARVKIDNDHEKLPWEWMYDRDDAAFLRKAYAAVDLLIDFLEEKQIAEWIDSPRRVVLRSIFISTAQEFNAVFPIDHSHRFFYELAPFIEENQQLLLAPALGCELYDEFLTKYQQNQITTAQDKRILTLIQRFLALQTIETACLRFAISVFPEGIAQRFLASSGGRHASNAPNDESIRKYATLIAKQAESALNDVKMAVKNLRAADINYPLLPNNKASNGFFRT
ncbi:MAG: hypothetical protein LBS50_00375 [Prevotellaceae bacterium]|jgi:hypothetical protein|nr:hypothetical protein [Prevotellaceae bacterium]